MNATEIKTNHTKYNLQSWSKQKGLNPIAVEKGEGIYFWDYDGSRYTDMSSQLVNLNVGFGCRPIIDAIKEQAEKFCFVGPSYACESRSKLAEMVVDLMPDNIAKVFFTNGGADANENAIKMARMYTGRKKVFSRYRSYHGSTFGAGQPHRRAEKVSAGAWYPRLREVLRPVHVPRQPPVRKREGVQRVLR